MRLQAMDEQGIDVEALSINPNWYKLDRDLAKQVCQVQNEKLAEACAEQPRPLRRLRHGGAAASRTSPPSSSRRA